MTAHAILQQLEMTPEDVRITPEQLLSDYQRLGSPREIDAVLRLMEGMIAYTKYCNESYVQLEHQLGETQDKVNRLKRANGDLRTELEGTHEANSILRAAVQQLANEIADNGAEPLSQPIAPGFVPFEEESTTTGNTGYPFTITFTDQNGRPLETHWYELIM